MKIRELIDALETLAKKRGDNLNVSTWEYNGTIQEPKIEMWIKADSETFYGIII
jgi:hypothetical protein